MTAVNTCFTLSKMQSTTHFGFQANQVARTPMNAHLIFKFFVPNACLNYKFFSKNIFSAKVENQNKQTLLHRPRPSCLACSSRRNNSAKYGLASPFCCPCSLICMHKNTNSWTGQ